MSAVSIVTGDIAVAFAALSYAGKLAITVIADPEHCRDLTLVQTALQDQLDRLAGSEPAPEALPPDSSD
jgi:hypothetical protein